MPARSLFEQNAPELAQALLGHKLVHKTAEGITSGIIAETEAYSQDDAASHSYRGQTERTKIMFGSGGYAYVYFTYGMHYCFNIVSGPKGHGQAVLIRALEPAEGVELMKHRRKKEQERELCNGPAKLVQAMGISLADYGKPLFEGNLVIELFSGQKFDIASGPRIGIKKETEKPWRFWIKGNDFVSRM